MDKPAIGRLASSKFPRKKMRKRKPVKDVRTLEEIIEEDSRAAIVLYSDKSRSDGTTALERRRLLNIYAGIAESPPGKSFLEKLATAVDYFKKHGFPGFLGKDFTQGDITRPDEAIFPIVFSADRLADLLWLLDAWRRDDVNALSDRLVECDCKHFENHKTTEELLLESRISANRAANKRLIDYVLKRDGPRACGTSRWLNRDGGRESLSVKRSFHFSRVNFAFSAMRFDGFTSFVETHIQPIQASVRPSTRPEILACARDQIFKAANIMLWGIQPAVVADSSGVPTFRYNYQCDWHHITTAFAELLTGTSCELRFCITCGADISHLKHGAKKCNECQTKKRKPR